MHAHSFTNGTIGLTLAGTKFEVLEPPRSKENSLVKIITHGACYLSMDEAMNLAEEIINAFRECSEAKYQETIEQQKDESVESTAMLILKMMEKKI